MLDEPHLTDGSGIKPGIGPTSRSPYASQQEQQRAASRDSMAAQRSWRKPPHIAWRKFRALFAQYGTEADGAYGSPPRYGYERTTAPAGWMYGVSIVLALVALVCVTLSSGLFSKRDDRVALALQSAEGTITSAEPRSSLRPSLPSIAAVPSTALPQTSPTASSTSSANSSATSSATSASLAPALAQPLASPAERDRSAERVVTRQKPEGPAAMPHPRAEVDLQIARINMDKNNLTTARAALSRALVAEPNNISAIKMNADLQDREFKRNGILLAARSCAAQDQWNCVWRNAGEALVIDPSNAEAKQLLTQARWQSELDTRTGVTSPLGIKRSP
jgi:hypothetical protein